MKFKIRNEFQIGVLVVVSLVVLIWGVNFLMGINVFKKETTYFAIYEKIEGLRVSNPVQINGFSVGQVRDISFLDDHSGRILVQIELSEEATDLPKYTVAKISSMDLLGSKSVNLILGKELENYHQPGDTLRSSVEGSLTEEVNKQILPLKKKAEDLLSSIDTLVGVVQTILNKEARDNLSASFASIKNALGTFEVVALRMDTLIYSEKMKIDQILMNFNSISNNLRNNNENITMILDNLNYITDSIAASNLTATINNASIAFANAANIMEKINQGEGTIGQLVNNDSLYYHLENSARDLDKLLIDVEEHPGRYVHVSVFGGKTKDDKKKEKAEKKAAKEKEKQ